MTENVLELNPSNPLFQQSGQTGWANGSEIDDFDYVPISPWGPLALAAGVFSLAAYFGIFGIYLALVATVLGVTGVTQIRKAEGALKGGWFAWCGLVLSSCSLVLGTVRMVHAYSTECPEGFHRVNFPKDISAKQFIYIPQRTLHPDVEPLVGQKVFLKGFMWQTQKDEGLTEFVLLKDNGECCFGGKAQPYDMMSIRLQNGLTTRAYTGMVAVAGVLQVNLKAGDNEAVYIIDATMVEEAQTRF